MSQSKEEQAILHLLNAYTCLAPTNDDHDKARGLLAEMQRSGAKPEDISRALCSILYDGLAYGNWPSAIITLDSRDKNGG